MMITIEPASELDLHDILGLQKKAFYGQAVIYNDFTLPSLTQTLDDLKTEFRQMSIYKVEINGKLIASVRCWVRKRALYVEKLFVDPEFQNQGVGTKIMDELESRYSPDVDRYELATGDRSARNLHLYKKLGYKEIGRKSLNDNCSLVVLEKLAERKLA